jgi:hypothetical protein
MPSILSFRSQGEICYLSAAPKPETFTDSAGIEQIRKDKDQKRMTKKVFLWFQCVIWLKREAALSRHETSNL